MDADVSVLLTDNVTIANLNHTYRGQDKPTDVLAFSQTEGTAFLDESSGLLGDIVISVEQARMQALEYGHGVAREIGFLAVHGLLHLLGYDHERPDDETRMMAQTEAILGAEGLTRS